jgi:hypothetical protein
VRDRDPFRHDHPPGVDDDLLHLDLVDRVEPNVTQL